MTALFLKRTTVFFIVFLSFPFNSVAQDQDAKRFWIEPKFGYQFTELRLINFYIDNFWNTFPIGQDFDPFEGAISPSLSLGWSPIEKLPQLFLELELGYLADQRTAQTHWTNIDFDLELSYASYIAHLNPVYVLNVSPKVNVTLGVGISFMQGQFTVKSDGFVDPNINAQDQEVIWEDFAIGGRETVGVEYKVTRDLWLALHLQYQWLRTDEVESNNPDAEPFTLGSQELDIELSGFASSFGIKYQF